MDWRLCFGLRCAPNIFDSLSSLIVEIAHSRGATSVVNYINDFFIITDSAAQCKLERDIVVDAIRHLGFDGYMNWSKFSIPWRTTPCFGYASGAALCLWIMIGSTPS